MKKKNTLFVRWVEFVSLASLVALAQTAQAAIQVVNPTDGVSVTTTHLGTDNWALVDNPPIGNFRSLSGDGMLGFAPTGPFSQGTSVIPTSGAVDSGYHITTIFLGNASSGLNYARLDLDADGNYETVFELDFGVDTAFAGDVITRYAFEDAPGGSLDIPEALVAMNAVPEPGSLTFLVFGLVGLQIRRRR